MNISLTTRDEKFIAEKLKTGAYASPDEVLREGLRLLEREDERRRKISWLQTEVEKGFLGPFTEWTKSDSDKLRALVAGREDKAR
jgi:putative addiction module CopG family antidote